MGVYCQVAFNPQGDFLAIGDNEGTLRVFEVSKLLQSGIVTTDQASITLAAHEETIFDVTFNPDGTQISTASADLTRTAKVWDSRTGEELQVLSGHDAGVYGVAYSPNGDRIVTSSVDRTARVWNSTTGELLFTILGHAGSVFRAAYSPDGTMIATASYDGTTKLWDSETGQELVTLYGHKDGVSAVEFSTDGSRLFTGSVDGTNRIYLLELEELVALAQERLTRYFTEEECKKYLHTETCPPAP
jgi:WD40 repeat protein